MQTCGEKNKMDKMSGQFGGQIVRHKSMEKLVEEMGKTLWCEIALKNCVVKLIDKRDRKIGWNFFFIILKSFVEKMCGKITWKIVWKVV